MSHASEGGQAPDQASSGRQTGAAVPPGQIIPKARNAASHPTSHKQHGDTRLATAPDRPTDGVSQSLEAGSGGGGARQDLLDDRRLGIGVVLCVLPWSLRERALRLLVQKAILTIDAEVIAEPHHALNLWAA